MRRTDTFGERVREARMDAQLSQTELGRRVDRSMAWVSCMERNRYGPDGPPVAMVFGLAAALDVTIEWLWLGEVR